MKKIIIPKIKSMPVKNVEEIREDASTMQHMIEGGFSAGPFIKHGIALHHSQVSEKPYNFFVVKRAVVGAGPNEIIAILNPEIVEVDKRSQTMHLEGCLSFPFRQDKKVLRYNRIKVKYDVLDPEGKTLIPREEWTVGLMAMVFQHEIGHANVEHIYQHRH